MPLVNESIFNAPIRWRSKEQCPADQKYYAPEQTMDTITFGSSNSKGEPVQ